MKTITLEQVNENINNLRLDVIELKVTWSSQEYLQRLRKN